MELKKEHLLFMDGLKAVAAILVFNIHFLNAYYSGIYTLDSADFHTASGVEWFIGATPFNLVYAGKLGARFFLGISAFLIVRNYYMFHNNSSPGRFLVNVLKRYLRLVIPILAVNLLIVPAMYLNLYQNVNAAQIIGSQEFFGVYNQFAPNILEAVREAVYGCFVFGSNEYNGPLWFIQYEFLGCMLISLILMIFGKNKFRFLAYFLGIIVFIRTDYLVMILCALAADVIVNFSEKIEKVLVFSLIPRIKLQVRNLLWVLLIPVLFFATYPSYGTNLEGSIYTIAPPKVLFYYNVVIPCFLCLIYYLRPLQRIFEWKPLMKLNRISYCFYLIHFPILCIVSSFVFLNLHSMVNYHILALFNYLATFGISVIAAIILTKLTYQPASVLAQKIAEKFE